MHLYLATLAYLSYITVRYNELNEVCYLEIIIPFIAFFIFATACIAFFILDIACDVNLLFNKKACD